MKYFNNVLLASKDRVIIEKEQSIIQTTTAGGIILDSGSSTIAKKRNQSIRYKVFAVAEGYEGPLKEGDYVETEQGAKIIPLAYHRDNQEALDHVVNGALEAADEAMKLYTVRTSQIIVAYRE